jgi:hypothetical protein
LMQINSTVQGGAIMRTEASMRDLAV